MTEKQGGSDVRANTTRAEAAGDGAYEITGHKWFCSYPPCDVFLTLAQASAGLSCFLIEGTRPRLSHPAAQGQARHPLAALQRGRVPGGARPAGGRGGPGRGPRSSPHGQPHPARLPDRVGGVDALRSDPRQPCTTPATASAFGKLLAEQPAMQNVIADLAARSEAATGGGDAHRARLRRGQFGPSAVLPTR